MGIWTPDEGTSYNINTILATMASSMDTAIGPYVSDTGWVAITPNAGYTAGEGLAWRRVGKEVKLRGLVTKTGSNYGTTYEPVFTLPAGSRPAIFSRWPVASFISSTESRLVHANIAADGVVSVGSSETGSDVARFAAVTFYID